MVGEGRSTAGSGAQDVVFPAKKARFLCLQALSSQNGDKFDTLAELDALDAAGKTISHKGRKILYADSEETLAEGDQAENAIDNDPNTFWHTLWSQAHTSHPHTLVMDLGAKHELFGVRLLPRQDSPNGRIKDYRMYSSIPPF